MENKTNNNFIKTKEGFICISKTNNKLNTFGFNNPYWKNNVELFISRMKGNSEILNIKKITKSNRNRILVEAMCSCGEKFNWIFHSNLDKTDKFMCNKCKKNFYSRKKKIKI